jgi:hypothetical protein
LRTITFRAAALRAAAARPLAVAARSHRLKLRLLLVGEDLGELCIDFLLQDGELLLLCSRQVELRLNARGKDLTGLGHPDTRTAAAESSTTAKSTSAETATAETSATTGRAETLRRPKSARTIAAVAETATSARSLEAASLASFGNHLLREIGDLLLGDDALVLCVDTVEKALQARIADFLACQLAVMIRIEGHQPIDDTVGRGSSLSLPALAALPALRRAFLVVGWLRDGICASEENRRGGEETASVFSNRS